MKHLFYALLSVLALASCRSVGLVSVEYLEPASISFPAEVKKVAVVNNTQPDDWRKRVRQLNEAVEVDQTELGVVEADGQMAAEAFAYGLADGNYFDAVVICDSALRKADYVNRDARLGKQEVDALTSALQADLLFSLDKVQVFFRKGVTYDPDMQLPMQVVDARMRSVVRLYLPGRIAPLATVNTVDSLYWIGTWQVDTAMVQEAAARVSEMAVRHVLPTWKKVTRYYYAGENVAMRDAAVCVREASWDEALQLWKGVYAQKDAKGRMRAAFNIALYYEMHDRLQEALEWVQKARELAGLRSKRSETDSGKQDADYSMIAQYEQDLKIRVEQLAKLQLQMQRFQNDF